MKTVLAATLLAGCGYAASGDNNEVPPVRTCELGQLTGTEVGQTIEPFEVRRCDGSRVDLQALACGYPLTLLDIGSAAFPICVQATDLYATDSEFDELQAMGLHIVQVFTTDAQLEPATTLFCSNYSEQHNIDFDFLVDPLALTDALSTVHPLNLVVDANGLIIHKWNPVIPDDRNTILRSLLGEL